MTDDRPDDSGDDAADADTHDRRATPMDDTDTDADDARTARRESTPQAGGAGAPQGAPQNAGRGGGRQRPGRPDERVSLLDRDPRELIYWAGLLTCGLLALVALVSLYTSVLDVIRTWVDPEYRSLFRSAFSLVVLVVAVVGVSLTVRELSD